MGRGVIELDSIWEKDESSVAQPPSEETLAAINDSVSDPGFMPKLIATILRLAHGHYPAQVLGFSSGKNLPGGICAEDLALTLLERILLGKRPWDMQAKPDFLLFCKMHARSMVSNLFALSDTIRRTSMSPIEEEDENGNPVGNAVTEFNSESEEGHRVRGREEFINVANAFLEDFALSLDDDSTEQKLIMAVMDDKDTVKEPREGSTELLVLDRPYMIDKLKITDREFDSALKRLQRKHKEFLPKWLEQKKLTTQEIGEMLYGR
jgi:hypothetical protein